MCFAQPCRFVVANPLHLSHPHPLSFPCSSLARSRHRARQAARSRPCGTPAPPCVPRCRRWAGPSPGRASRPCSACRRTSTSASPTEPTPPRPCRTPRRSCWSSCGTASRSGTTPMFSRCVAGNLSRALVIQMAPQCAVLSPFAHAFARSCSAPGACARRRRPTFSRPSTINSTAKPVTCASGYLCPSVEVTCS